MTESAEANSTPATGHQNQPEQDSPAVKRLADQMLAILKADGGAYLPDALDAIYSVLCALAVYFIPNMDLKQAETEVQRPDVNDALKKAAKLAPDFLLASGRSPFVSIVAAANILMIVSDEYRKRDAELCSGAEQKNAPLDRSEMRKE